MNEEELLLHYGVKGMKWGVRRSRTKGPSTVRRHVDSMKRDFGHRKTLKNLKNMTDEELRSTTDRVRIENDLKRLTAKKKRKTRINKPLWWLRPSKIKK